MSKEKCQTFLKHRVCPRGVCCPNHHPYSKTPNSHNTVHLEKSFDLLFGRIHNIEMKQIEILARMEFLSKFEKICDSEDLIVKTSTTLEQTNRGLDANIENMEALIQKMSVLTLSVKKNSEELSQLGASGVPTRYTLNRNQDQIGSVRDRAEKIIEADHTE